MESSFLLTLVPIACSFWVFFDTCTNHIGVYRDEQQKTHGRSPVWWGIAVLLIVFIYLPWYLIQRGQLITNAKAHPVNSDKNLGILILATLSMFIFWFFHLRD